MINAKEKAEVVTICDYLGRLKFFPVLPRAFTKHGAIMAATVIKIPQALKSYFMDKPDGRTRCK